VSAPVCPHERDVLDLVAIGQWPRRADAPLRAHVATCATCAEVAAIAVAVREWSEADSVAHVPEASVVWHRAQVRARAAAARTASKPIWVAQATAFVALMVALAWMGPGAGWYASLWSGVAGAAPTVEVTAPVLSFWPDSAAVETFWSGWGRAVLLAAGALLLLASVAVGALRSSERSEISNNR